MIIFLFSAAIFDFSDKFSLLDKLISLKLKEKDIVFQISLSKKILILREIGN